MKAKLVLGLIVLIVIVFFGSIVTFPYWTSEIVEITITDKERVIDTDDSYYLIFTETNEGEEVFKNKDVWRWLKKNSSDLYGRLQTGETYEVRVYGWRITWFSMYRNIVRIQE